MKHTVFIPVVTAFFTSFAYPQIELPRSTGNQIVSHTGYTLSYNEEHEQADWVAYKLTASEVRAAMDRTNDYRADPKVRTGSASLHDYKGSGYDRGHLAPAADMKWSYTVMSESFYLSNMSPQKAGFNRGIWKGREAQVRQWAIDNSSVYVVTAGVLKSGLSSIGTNRVSVPRYYFKVILDYTEPEIKGIGFILPNESSKSSLKSYAVTIDEVESVTGIDFFYSLPDEVEKLVESSVDLTLWSFVPYKSTAGGGTATQCLGNTKSGRRCRNQTKNELGYCYLHDPSKSVTKSLDRLDISVRCSGVTKKDLRCKRKTKSPNRLCYQHGGN